MSAEITKRGGPPTSSIGALHLGLGTADALLLDDIAALAEPGGVEHVQRHAIEVNALAHHIARGPRNGRHDRRVVPGQAVEKTRLAGVRSPRDHDHHTLAQQPSLAGACHHALEVITH